MKVKGALFLCKKGLFPVLKRGTFRVREKVGGGTVPLSPPPRRAASAPLSHTATERQLYYNYITMEADTYKQHQTPVYLNSLIVPYQSARPGLRSCTDSTLLHVP